MRKNHRKGQIDAECFRKLPERAQEIWFQYCDSAVMNNRPFDLNFGTYMGFDYDECKSPIEKIFNFAYDLVAFSEGYMGFFLTPQYEISRMMADPSKYIVDFVFIAEEVDGMVEIEKPSFKLAIECDGHDFHEKTKAQVIYDNEREYELKMQGFDVLRFSGSQIYNNPFKCAKQTLEYIKAKIGEKEVDANNE